MIKVQVMSGVVHFLLTFRQMCDLNLTNTWACVAEMHDIH